MTTTSPCQDRGRAFFHDHIGRYFTPQDYVFDAQGKCPICQKPAALRKNRKSAACAAQITLTTKLPHYKNKRSKKIDGQDIASPASIFTPGGFFLVSKEKSFIATNVTRPDDLPADIFWSPVLPGLQAPVKRALLLNPPKPPFLFAITTYKATVPLIITESSDRIFFCGEERPEPINRKRCIEIYEMTKRFGVNVIKNAAIVKASIAEGTGNPERFDKLIEANPELKDLWNDIPDCALNSAETAYALTLSIETDEPNPIVDFLNAA